MPNDFLLYGATGFVGGYIARAAVQSGLRPVLAGRSAPGTQSLAAELGLEARVFRLDDPPAIDRALGDVPLLLHCAGPYLYTSQPMVDACLRTGTHYLDLTGELPIYEAVAARGAEAEARGIMLMPGVGFDVVPTDCLAAHLKRRLPSATHLALAFQSHGPAGMPPGTQRTAIELLSYGNRVRRNGRLERPARAIHTRMVDFGSGPIEVTRLSWGDVFMAYYSTGIPNIEDYLALSAGQRRLLGALQYLGPFFKIAAVRDLLKRGVRPGSTPEQRDRTATHVWGEVTDDSGNTATARLHGPEAGVIWTSRAALATVRKVLAGEAPPGFQTPARAYGADFVLECDGVARKDLD